MRDRCDNDECDQEDYEIGGLIEIDGENYESDMCHNCSRYYVTDPKPVKEN